VLGGGIMAPAGIVACAAPTLRALRIAPSEALTVDGQPAIAAPRG
jgi:hypothetical protein